MKTIAEFVEAEETVVMLREKGVDYSQGYFHGAPRPVATEFAQIGVPRRAVLDGPDPRASTSCRPSWATPSGPTPSTTTRCSTT